MNQDHLSIIPRHEIFPLEWDTFVDQSDEAWFWHLSSAIDGYNTWDGYNDLSFAVRNSARNNSIVAVMPLHKAKTRIPYFSRLESTGGPAYANEIQPKERKIVSSLIANTLNNLAHKHKALHTDLSLPPLSPKVRNAEWPMVNPFAANGLAETSTMSWIISMTALSEIDLWKKVAHRTRKAVNKANRSGYQVRLGQKSDINLYMKLHKETSKRNFLTEKPRAYAENIFEKLIPKGLAKIFIAEKDEKAVAFHTFAIYKEAAIYWTTGCTDEALRDGVNNFLLWDAMRALKNEGVNWLECGEALPNSSTTKLQRINDFKRSFGGKLYPYYRGRLTTYPIPDAIFGVLRAFRKS